jgi:hypothetical protein
VAKEKKQPNHWGASPGKLALVGVLAAVLIAVLYVQFGRSSESPPARPAGAPPRASRAAARPASTAPAAAQAAAASGSGAGEWFIESIDRRQWSSPELAQVIRYDPFALPASFPRPGEQALVGGSGGPANAAAAEDRRSQVIEDSRQQLAELQRQGVQVIINGQNEAAALIGDFIVRVGDEINGFTVTAIDADGVYVERKLDQ